MTPLTRLFSSVFTVAWLIVCFGAAIFLGKLLPGYVGFFASIILWAVLFATPFYILRRRTDARAKETPLVEYIASKLPKRPPDHILVQEKNVMIDQVGLVFETAGYENLNRDQCRDLALKLFERLGEQYETFALFFSEEDGLNYRPVVRGEVEADGQGVFRAYLVRHKSVMD